MGQPAILIHFLLSSQPEPTEEDIEKNPELKKLQIYGAGNAKYMNHLFTAEATSLYWQNRWSHIFLALADYNKLTTNIGATSAGGSQGMLKMYPNHDNQPTENTYYLTR